MDAPHWHGACSCPPVPPQCRGIATLLSLSLAAFLLAPRGHATGESARGELDAALAFSRTAARATARIGASVVSVRAFAAGREEFGSAVIVEESGLALTALHVVAASSAVAVITRDGEEFPARLRGRDGSLDLALLEILAPGRRFPVALLADEAEHDLGESVLVVGNPFGLGGSVSLGVLAGRGRTGIVTGCRAPMLQTDAAINPGCSGGALGNLHGEVLGLVDAILTRDGRSHGIGFAIPASELRYALPFLVKGEPVTRPWLGIVVRPVVGLEEGLSVTAVTPDGPGLKAGVRVGDVLLRLGESRLGGLDELRHALRRLDAGQQVALGLRRGPKLLTLDLVVEARVDAD